MLYYDYYNTTTCITIITVIIDYHCHVLQLEEAFQIGKLALIVKDLLYVFVLASSIE